MLTRHRPGRATGTGGVKSAARKPSYVRRMLVLRKKSILEAAIRVIAREGITGVTLQQIAIEAGCSYGVVSFHFKSKSRLLLATLSALLEDYDRVLQRALLKAGPSPASRLLAVLDADFDRGAASRKRIAVWMAFWAEAPRNSSYRRRCAEMKERYVDLVGRIVRELAADVRPGPDPDHVTRGLNAMIDGFWLYHQVAGSDPAKRERSRLACRSYLKLAFPGAFDRLRPARPAPRSD